MSKTVGYLAAISLVASGCAGDVPVSPPASSDPSTLYWSLTLDHRAVTLSTTAPYDTIQLTATARVASGAVVSGTRTPTFTSLDLERIEVSADGLVHAHGVGDQIGVVASLTEGNLTHADTVFINVTDAVPTSPLTMFSIHPVPGDSAKLALGLNTQLLARAADAAGNPFTDISVDFSSLDLTTATIDRVSGSITALRPGLVTFVATATVFGVTTVDTLPYRIGYPVAFFLQAAPQTNASGQTVWSFAPNNITAGTGAYAVFGNPAGPPIDVTFDDPTNVAQYQPFCVPPFTDIYPAMCGSGNIPAFARAPGDQSGTTSIRSRAFPVAGTYTWHSTIFGTTGTIVVVNESLTP
jgi:hypothetical protein